jgi:hypothetical protein
VRRCTEAEEVEFAEMVRRTTVADPPAGGMSHILAAARVHSRRSKRQPWCLPKLLSRLELAERRRTLEAAPQAASFLLVLEGTLAPLASPRPYLPYKYSHKTL